MKYPDFRRAHLMARLSSSAYETDLNALSLAVAQLGLEYVAVITGPGFQALIVREPDKSNIVVFRGTPVTCGRDIEDAIRALLIDLGADHITTPGGGRILAGLYRAVLRYWPQIQQHLDLALPVVLTGHSLGATEALAAGAMISRVIPIEVYAFAPFQCADGAFWKAVYDGRSAPVIFGAELDFAPGWNHADPVTVLAGPIWHLLANGGIELVNSWPAYRESVADHSDLNYVSLLARLAQPEAAPA